MTRDMRLTKPQRRQQVRAAKARAEETRNNINNAMPVPVTSNPAPHSGPVSNIAPSNGAAQHQSSDTSPKRTREEIALEKAAKAEKRKQAFAAKARAVEAQKNIENTMPAGPTPEPTAHSGPASNVSPSNGAAQHRSSGISLNSNSTTAAGMSQQTALQTAPQAFGSRDPQTPVPQLPIKPSEPLGLDRLRQLMKEDSREVEYDTGSFERHDASAGYGDSTSDDIIDAFGRLAIGAEEAERQRYAEIEARGDRMRASAVERQNALNSSKAAQSALEMKALVSTTYLIGSARANEG